MFSLFTVMLLSAGFFVLTLSPTVSPEYAVPFNFTLALPFLLAAIFNRELLPGLEGSGFLAARQVVGEWRRPFGVP